MIRRTGRISVDAILFDLDGTLIDSKKDLFLSVRYLQDKYAKRRSTEAEVATFIGDGVVKLVQRALPGVEGNLRREAVKTFKRYYRQHCLDHTRLYPGVRQMLAHFRHKKLAVVTNKPVRVSRRILRGLGILSAFRVVLGGDSLRTKKPHPAPIRFALTRMRVSQPQNALMVGDGKNDILAGRAAGTWTCGIRSNIGSRAKLLAAQPHFRILNTRQLMRFIN